MNGFGQRYVIDTNSLSQLRRHRRGSEFFEEHVVVPAEVLREAAGFPDVNELRRISYSTTPQVLARLIEVMATVPATDIRLVDLYANKGSADPLVVACALDGRTQDSQYLDAPEWVVVTGDDAVRSKAEEFGLPVIGNADFAAVIDAAQEMGSDDGEAAALVPR